MENNGHHPVVPVSQVAQPLGVGIAEYGIEVEESHHLSEYLNILMKRKWWAIGFFVGMVTIVGLYTYMQTPIYRAATILQIVQDNPQYFMGDRGDPLTMAMQYGDSQNRFYETQYKLLQSRSLALKIIETLNLQNYPEFKVSDEDRRRMSPEEIKISLADRLGNELEITPIKNTFLVEVAYQSPNKELAQKIVNATYKEYLRFGMETRQQSYVLIKEWLEKELQQLAQKVEVSQKKLFDHDQQKGVLLVGEDNVVVKKFVELNKLLVTAQSERMIKEAQYQQIKQKGADAPLVVNNPLVSSLRQDVIRQEAKVSGIKKIFGKNYPQLQTESATLQELRSRLNNEVRRTETAIKADYEVAQRTENFLQEEFAAQKANVEKLQNNMVQHLILKRDVQTNEQLYQGLLARMKEASAASTMVPSNSAIIEPAELPRVPFSPRTGRNMALAVLLGLIGGVSLAFVVEYLDKSIKTVEELERVTRLPYLGIVPLSSGNAKEALAEQSLYRITYDDPKSLIAEAIHHVNTAVMLSLSERPPGAILVTSPSPSEGKTTLCLNLAASMAMNGNRVIIVDTDLRRPMLHRIFQQRGEPGLSNFLTGHAAVSEIIRPTGIPDLFFIPAGAIPPNPVPLLKSQGLKDLIATLRQDFQHLIFDTPPVIGFADGRAVSPLVDGVILVFKHHFTSREAGRLATQLLNQVNAPILGVVLNMTQTKKIGYGGYYAYYKYYDKYYSHYHNEEGGAE
jgi:succinoglycan biosynthesis transport protein ExoP